MADKKSFLSGLKKNKNPGDTPSSDDNIDHSASFTPELPLINLIPAEVIQGYELKALQQKFIKGIGLLTVIILALWGVLFGLEKITEMRVASAQSEAAAYGQQVQALQPYADYRESVQNKRTTIGEKMSTEVDTGSIIEELRNIASSTGVSLSSSIQISVNTGETEGNVSGGNSGAGCQSADPFTSQPSIGCVTFSGEGERTDVADFIENLNSHDYFNNTFVPETTSGETSQFTGSVNYTGGFLTNSYADLLTPIPGEEEIIGEAPVTEEPGINLPTIDEEGQQ